MKRLVLLFVLLCLLALVPGASAQGAIETNKHEFCRGGEYRHTYLRQATSKDGETPRRIIVRFAGPRDGNNAPRYQVENLTTGYVVVEDGAQFYWDVPEDAPLPFVVSFDVLVKTQDLPALQITPLDVLIEYTTFTDRAASIEVWHCLHCIYLPAMMSS